MNKNISSIIMKLALEGRADLALEILGQGKPLPPKVTAYHCGPKIQKFSLKYVGSGEGMSALGPGIYFATEKFVAANYCKYARNSYMTEVLIATRGLYDAIWGIPLNLRESLHVATDALAHEMGKKRLPPGLRLTHGPGVIGEVFRHFGAQKGREFLVDLGVTGAYENLKSDLGFEIAVYDPSIVRIVRSEEYQSEE